MEGTYALCLTYMHDALGAPTKPTPSLPVPLRDLGLTDQVRSLDELLRAASRPGVPAQWLKAGVGLVASGGGAASGGRYDSAELVPL